MDEFNWTFYIFHPFIRGHKNLHNFEGYHRALKEILFSKDEEIDRVQTSIDFVRKKRKTK